MKKLISLFIYYILGGVANARFNGVKIGGECRIYIKDFGSEPFLIDIGNRVTIGSGVKLLTHDGALSLVKDEKGRRHYYSHLKIGSNVFIGINAIIMPGVIIEDDVIIGAGSVVAKSVPSGSIVAGNPARIIGTLERYFIKNQSLPSDISVDKTKKSHRKRVLSVALNHSRDYMKIR